MKPGSNTCTGLKKGAWTADEDILLKNCIEKHGEGKWHLIPLKAGLNRCRKSCRLRWMNYLRPNIKRGDFAEEEVDLILRLHKLLGNRWSLIAGRIPGRTANDVKNYWNTHILCRSKQQKKALNNIEEDTSGAVIKPKPQTFSRTLHVGENTHTHHGCNQKTSDDGANSNLNVSSRLMPSNVVDDNLSEYLEDLFDDCENEIKRKYGCSFGGPSAEVMALNVVEQGDDQISLFDFPMDEVMRDLINFHHL